MKKLKVITAESAADLEKQVNEFLSRHATPPECPANFQRNIFYPRQDEKGQPYQFGGWGLSTQETYTAFITYWDERSEE